MSLVRPYPAYVSINTIVVVNTGHQVVLCTEDISYFSTEKPLMKITGNSCCRLKSSNWKLYIIHKKLFDTNAVSASVVLVSTSNFQYNKTSILNITLNSDTFTTNSLQGNQQVQLIKKKMYSRKRS